MPFSAIAVANEFLAVAKKHGELLTPMKLQKLVFYAHGWSLALAQEPLVSNRIEAWAWGPVIPDLYRQFRMYGNEPILRPACYTALRGSGFAVVTPSLDDYPNDAGKREARRIIERVWEIYGKFSAAKLSNATHAKGTPWEQVYKEGQQSIEILNPIIADYFKGQVHAH